MRAWILDGVARRAVETPKKAWNGVPSPCEHKLATVLDCRGHMHGSTALAAAPGSWAFVHNSFAGSMMILPAMPTGL